MPRKRLTERETAQKLYLDSKGKLRPKEIAERLKVDPARVRQWKHKDNWESKLPRRGGQPGNRNAAGHGAPKGNTNAETHGAYSLPRLQNWSEEDRQRLETLSGEFDPLAREQMKRLLAKQEDLERRIAGLDGGEEDETLYLDRMMTMQLPGGQDMKYRSESSAHSRRMVYEAELNRVQGRIIKLLDSMRAREDSEKRMQFDRERFKFAKEKALGEFSDGSEPDSDEDVDEVIDE